MANNIFSKLNDHFSKCLGGGILSTISRYTGRFAIDYLKKNCFASHEYNQKFVNIRDAFHLSTAKYGSSIPLSFGKTRVAGKIIWADQIIERNKVTNSQNYVQNSNIEHHQETVNLTYFLNFAVCLGSGPIERIGKIWLGEEIINLDKYKYRLYKGDNEQLPDPLIQKKLGELTPAYRGLAYILFEELPLADFKHVVPNFNFEVIRKPVMQAPGLVPNLITAMVMLPGCGEYSYDTKIQKSYQLDLHKQKINQHIINSHNSENIADSRHSLNQLQANYQNIHWIAPKSYWFGTSLDIKYCLIKPGVERCHDQYYYSEKWQVGQYDRHNAHLISKDKYNLPQYNGSISDASMLRYLLLLKKHNLKIMFYPDLLIDAVNRPNSRHLSGSIEDISNFFNKKYGYNEFILHQAHLVKDHVDAFIIGSELNSLTKINQNGYFPAIDELVKLAHLVKKFLGNKVKVSYAAGYLEYHHTKNGWYHLDNLWACNSIDFVGINAYFPLTNSTSSIITEQEIKAGIQGGEGYDYYYNQLGEKELSKPAYSWKNISYWWRNQHINPDKKVTSWKPKSKPIWFTQFGFPTIDKATNELAISSKENSTNYKIPKYSTGKADFTIQNLAIRTFLKFWQTQEYIGEMFLYCWDTRPYPAMPHSSLWWDSHLWEKGYWINQKTTSEHLASILLEISARAGLEAEITELLPINEQIEGLIFNHNITAMQAINNLRLAYFFDLVTYGQEQLYFKRRDSYSKPINIEHLLVKLTNQTYSKITKTDELSKINHLEVFFIENNQNYNLRHQNFSWEYIIASKQATIYLPLILSQNQVARISNNILANIACENELVSCRIVNHQFTIQPGNILRINDLTRNYIIRVIDIIQEDYEAIITGIIIDLKY